MTDSADKDTPPSAGADKTAARAERLKAALKANIARRKAQARARASDNGTKRQS